MAIQVKGHQTILDSAGFCNVEGASSSQGKRENLRHDVTRNHLRKVCPYDLGCRRPRPDFAGAFWPFSASAFLALLTMIACVQHKHPWVTRVAKQGTMRKQVGKGTSTQ